MKGITLSLSLSLSFNLSSLLPSIVGTPFYIMEYVDGRIFKDASLPSLKPSERNVIILVYHKFNLLFNFRGFIQKCARHWLQYIM